jgi:hypothetical protein
MGLNISYRTCLSGRQKTDLNIFTDSSCEPLSFPAPQDLGPLQHSHDLYTFVWPLLTLTSSISTLTPPFGMPFHWHASLLSYF